MYMAVKHGKVCKSIVSACEVVVQQKQHDNIGNELMAKAIVVMGASPPFVGRHLGWPSDVNSMAGFGACRILRILCVRFGGVRAWE